MFNIERQKKETWLAKHERAFKITNDYLGYNTDEAVKNLSNTAKIIAKVEICFCPSRSEVFTAFDCKYNKVSLSNYDNIIDFAKKLCKAKNKLFKSNASFKIGEPHFIHKFPSRLGVSFDIFGATSRKTHSL